MKWRHNGHLIMDRFRFEKKLSRVNLHFCKEPLKTLFQPNDTGYDEGNDKT